MYSTAIYSDHVADPGPMRALAQRLRTARSDTWHFILRRGRLRKLIKRAAKARFEGRFGFMFPENPNLFPPDYADLENLINRVLELKPARVLEMGGGQSTYALAFAVSRLRKAGLPCEFVTLDQSAEYLAVTRANLPESLRDVPVCLHSQLHVATKDGNKMSFFDDLPQGVFNFVYEDRCDHPEAPIAGDLLLLEERAIAADAPFSFTIDTMVATARMCKHRMRRRYWVTQEYTTGTNYLQA